MKFSAPHEVVHVREHPKPISAAAELLTNRIGELVMHELKQLDKVAYIRFASVYRSFEDIEDFKSVMDEVRT